MTPLRILGRAKSLVVHSRRNITGAWYSAASFLRGFRSSLSPNLLFAIVVLLIVLIGFQVWAQVRLSYKAVDMSQAITHRLIARSFAEKLRLFSERADRKEIDKRMDELARLNPAIRLFIVDQNGIMKNSPKSYGNTVLPLVDTRPIRRFLADKSARKIIYGDDPLKIRSSRPISVEPLRLNGGTHYLYVTLGEGAHIGSVETSIDGTVGFSSFLLTSISITLVAALILALAYVRLRKLQSGVAALSHDLRAPLSSVQGYLETLLQRGDSLDKTASKRFMNVALRSTQSAASMVDDLHHLSKIEASGETPPMERFSLNDLLMDVMLSATPEAEERGIKLSLDTPTFLPLTIGNIQLIERLLRNLVQNSLRYTPRGGRVDVTAQVVVNRLRVSVADSGCGIPASDLEMIASPFFRAKNIKQKTSGSGIGLSIASSIARIHGSELKILSREGQGTIVICELMQA